MTLNKELFSKSLAPFAKVSKQSVKKIPVDLLAVSKAIAVDMGSQANNENVDDAVKALHCRVGAYKSFLENIHEDEQGNAFVIEGSVDQAMIDKFGKGMGFKKPKKKDEEKSDDSEKSETETPETETPETQTKSDEDVDDVEKSDAEIDGVDFDGEGWGRDMAPKRFNPTRSALLKKSERPIGSRKGARKDHEIYQRNRDKAFNRGGSSSRCMS